MTDYLRCAFAFGFIKTSTALRFIGILLGSGEVAVVGADLGGLLGIYADFDGGERLTGLASERLALLGLLLELELVAPDALYTFDGADGPCAFDKSLLPGKAAFCGRWGLEGSSSNRSSR